MYCSHFIPFRRLPTASGAEEQQTNVTRPRVPFIKNNELPVGALEVKSKTTFAIVAVLSWSEMCAWRSYVGCTSHLFETWPLSFVVYVWVLIGIGLIVNTNQARCSK